MLREWRMRLALGAPLLILLALAAACARPHLENKASRAERARFAAWGAAAFAQIERDFRVPGATHYYEDQRRDKMMTAWPGGLYLMALSTAARVQPGQYRQPMYDLIAELNAHYWNPEGPVPGYDSEHMPKVVERYYDDNCWIALGLIDAYTLTRDPALMRRLQETYRYIFSGEDQALGGGIYWREGGGPRQAKKSKNTCSNAPAAVVALKLYGLTGDRKYLEDGRRIMAWLKANLQDPADHLFWDNKRLSGRISRAKFTYNAGMPIQAWLLLYRHTGEAQYLKEAQATAQGALQHWFDPELGTMRDDGAFAFTLTEALMRLTEADGDPHWRECARRTALFVHDRGIDPKGRYPEKWSQQGTAPYEKYMVRFTAPAAYLFWRLAEPQGRGGASWF